MGACLAAAAHRQAQRRRASVAWEGQGVWVSEGTGEQADGAHGAGFQGLRVGVRVSGSGFQGQGFRVRVSGFQGQGFRALDIEAQAQGFSGVGRAGSMGE